MASSSEVGDFLSRQSQTHSDGVFVFNPATMSTVNYLRQVVSERLTAAAEEILGVFGKTIVEYEEKIRRQREMLDIFLKPKVEIYRIDQRALKEEQEEEGHTEQQPPDQERISSLDQEELEVPKVKEEPEEICAIVVGDQFVLKQEEEEDASNSYPAVHVSDIEENSEVAPKTIPRHNMCKMCGKKRLRCKSPSSERPLLSSTCGKTVIRKSHFNTHQKVHTQPYVCKKRGERLDKSGSPHTCHICGKRFNWKNNLYSHVKLHTHPYCCIFCRKRFPQKSEYIAHLQKQDCETPYQRRTIGNKFKKVSRLNDDDRLDTHPYNCSTCGKSVAHQSQHNAHDKIKCRKSNSPSTRGRRFSRETSLQKCHKDNCHRKAKGDQQPINKEGSGLQSGRKRARTSKGQRGTTGALNQSGGRPGAKS